MGHDIGMGIPWVAWGVRLKNARQHEHNDYQKTSLNRKLSCSYERQRVLVKKNKSGVKNFFKIYMGHGIFELYLDFILTAFNQYTCIYSLFWISVCFIFCSILHKFC